MSLLEMEGTPVILRQNIAYLSIIHENKHAVSLRWKHNTSQIWRGIIIPKRSLWAAAVQNTAEPAQRLLFEYIRSPQAG